MNREQNDMAEISGKKISTKHISMELTADGARVTNLSLAGSRLILTIEAELADSQVRATEPESARNAALSPKADSSRMAPRGDSRDLDRTRNDRTDTEFVLRPPHPAPSSPAGIGFGDSEDVMGGLPADPFQSRPGASEAMRSAGGPAPLENTRLREITANSISFGPDTGLDGQSDFNFGHGSPIAPSAAPALEPAGEPAGAWNTPGVEPTGGINLGAMVGIPAAPAMTQPAPQPTQPPAAASALTLGGAPVPAAPRPASEVRPAAPAPMAAQPLMLGDAPAVPAPGIGMAQTPAAGQPLAPAAPAPAMNQPLPGGWNAGGVPGLNPASMESAPAPQPQMEMWDPSAMATLPAMSEDSSAIGGDRHGEPQPAISFGDAPVAPAPAAPALSLNSPGLAPSPAAPALSLNAPATAPAPIALDSPSGVPPLTLNAPGVSAPISLGGALAASPNAHVPGIAMDSPGGVPPLTLNAPGVSAPISLGGAPAASPGASVPGIAMNSSGGVPPLTLNAPEVSAPISLGGAPGASPSAPGIAMDAPGFGGLAMGPAAAPAPSLGLEPAPVAPPSAPAPIPSFAPMPAAAGISLEPQSPPPPPVSQDLPTVQGPFPVRSDAAERPVMELQDSAPKPEPEEKKEPEAGGTTVLIRYTCPKCKTQGMQAVDKVGTVVNCSNCGKAMRLVMKK